MWVWPSRDPKRNVVSSVVRSRLCSVPASLDSGIRVLVLYFSTCSSSSFSFWFLLLFDGILLSFLSIAVEKLFRCPLPYTRRCVFLSLSLGRETGRETGRWLFVMSIPAHTAFGFLAQSLWIEANIYNLPCASTTLRGGCSLPEKCVSPFSQTIWQEGGGNQNKPNDGCSSSSSSRPWEMLDIYLDISSSSWKESEKKVGSKCARSYSSLKSRLRNDVSS